MFCIALKNQEKSIFILIFLDFKYINKLFRTSPLHHPTHAPPFPVESSNKIHTGWLIGKVYGISLAGNFAGKNRAAFGVAHLGFEPCADRRIAQLDNIRSRVGEKLQ